MSFIFCVFVLTCFSFVSTTPPTKSVEVISLENKRYILTKVDDSFLYDDENYLYHIFDLDQLYHQMSMVTKPTLRDRISIKKATKYFEQLGFKKIHKRAINLLGSGIKWITGIPDHDDLVQVQESINHLIENNNVLKENNRKMTELLKNVGNDNTNSYILTEITEELQNIILTLNMAKNDQINTLALNLWEIEALINVEKKQLPIINVLEYSTIHICKVKNIIILIIKYPVIKHQCEHYRVTPLEFRHGKIVMDKQISKCNGIFQRTKKCIEILNTNICQTQEQDNCTTKILQNQNNARCTVKQEENDAIQVINSGHIILSGKHQVNNASIQGVNLINFEEKVNIDSVLYTNFEKKAKEYIITHQNEKFEILELIETDNKNLRFKNIKALRKFIIPLEEHPIKTTFVILSIIAFLILFTWLLGKCCAMYKTYHQTKSREKYLRTLKIEYAKRGLSLVDL